MEQEKAYVYQVYLDGSFSRAAERLYISQPALSLSIKKTETALGAPLFDRSRRPLALTEAGRAYIAGIERIARLEAEIAAEIGDIQHAEVGQVLLGGTHYLNAYILPGILASFRRAHPRVELVLEEHGSDRLARMLADCALDLTLSCDAALIAQYAHYPAFTDTILLAVHRDQPISPDLWALSYTAGDVLSGRHLAPGHPMVSLDAFPELEFALLREGNNLRQRCLAMFREAGCTPRVTATLSQLVTAYRLAEHGYASTFVSDRLVDGRSDALRFFSIDSPLARRDFFLLLPNRGYTPAATRAFLRHAIDAFSVAQPRQGMI